MPVHSIAVIGLGKIAQDQHLPVIAKNPNFRLDATVSQRGLSDGGAARSVPRSPVPGRAGDRLRRDLHATQRPLRDRPGRHRRGQACSARKAAFPDDDRAGGSRAPCRVPRPRDLHDLALPIQCGGRANARAARRTETPQTGDYLEGGCSPMASGQDWIWQQGGFGVFDPGINALSILTRIMPEPCSCGVRTLFILPTRTCRSPRV